MEEAVLFLLRNVGYEPIDVSSLATTPIHGLREGRGGLEAQGRGTWHQLDALASWTHSPAFIYPLRLVVEAKCYRRGKPIGLSVVRNTVGVAKDITENFFTVSRRRGSFQALRFNYASAIFSTSGYSSRAVEYAVAHQVFLIDYQRIPVIRPVVEAIMQFDESCLLVPSREAMRVARVLFRSRLNGEAYGQQVLLDYLTERGRFLIETSITETVRAIRGSYFGMLQGRWPMHLLRSEPLPPGAFANDVVPCRVHGNEFGEWRFEPRHLRPGEPDWFALEFHLPRVLAELVSQSWDDRVQVANLKQEHFSYIDLSGLIGGIRRNVRLELDRRWINEYITRHRSFVERDQSQSR